MPLNFPSMLAAPSVATETIFFKRGVSFFEHLKNETRQTNSRRNDASADEERNFKLSVVQGTAADARDQVLVAKKSSINCNREELALVTVSLIQTVVFFTVLSGSCVTRTLG